MIDAGSRDIAAGVLEQVRSHGWELKKLFLTHSHADHVAGAAFLREQTGCEVVVISMGPAPAESGGGGAQLPYPSDPLRRKHHPGDVLQAADPAPLRLLGALRGRAPAGA